MNLVFFGYLKHHFTSVGSIISAICIISAISLSYSVHCPTLTNCLGSLNAVGESRSSSISSGNLEEGLEEGLGVAGVEDGAGAGLLGPEELVEGAGGESGLGDVCNLLYTVMA